jgi:hypothetical protein
MNIVNSISVRYYFQHNACFERSTTLEATCPHISNFEMLLYTLRTLVAAFVAIDVGVLSTEAAEDTVMEKSWVRN